MTDITYHGTQPPPGYGAGTITIEDADGTEIGAVPHLPKHSPTGMAWGYGGSGPADAARSLLICALGDLARCPDCRPAYHCGGCTADHGDGAGCCRHCVAGRSCGACDDGYVHLPYQAFKAAVLVSAPDEWHLTRDWILEWAAQARATITFRPVAWRDGRPEPITAPTVED